MISVDVADPAQLERAAEQIEAQLGPIDVWINNAMVTTFSSFHEMSAEEFERVTHVSYLGTVNGTRAALRRMMPRGRGSIVQVGSALAYRSIPLQSAYCAAKAAVRAFTDSLRVELMRADGDIRLSMVQLGAHNTPQFDWARFRLKYQPRPLPPVYQPELAARAILFAADHGQRELWSSFSAFKAIVGGFLLPGLTDKLALKQAYEGQNDPNLPASPASSRPDNLFEAVDADTDAGSHGRFGDEAKTSSLYLSMLLAMRRLLG